ncbi:recombinase family protein [Leifsonia aquatica]|uniref:recombinase family protein n=1 Tax=Leifsonia aquatica TaxID=144185 RepID=UPI0038049485
MLIGYARVSTVEQDLERQISRLRELGVDQERIYVDRGFTGKTMTRDGLEKALAAVREGDTFVVPSLDRLARNTQGVLDVMQTLAERGITLSNGGNIYDPHDPMAKLYFTILAAVAEAEGGWISIRTKEGLAVARRRGRLQGRRKPVLTPKQDAAIGRHMDEADMTPAEIALLFNTSRAGVYRARARHRERQASADGTG